MGHSIPSDRPIRVSTQRARSVNNLKQIGAGDAQFPQRQQPLPGRHPRQGRQAAAELARADPAVHRADALFKEFKLDEPWDSPHNKALLERMPAIFAVPGSPAEPGMTFYRGFSGKRTLFDPTVPEGVELATITDGTSNTIARGRGQGGRALDQAGRRDPLRRPRPSKPEALKALLRGPGRPSSRRVQRPVLRRLGAVPQAIRSTRSSLRALITRDGGEVISADSF